MDQKETIYELIKEKTTTEAFVERVLSNHAMIPVLFDVIHSDKGTQKFYCEKIVRKLSELAPELIYPHFNDVVRMVESDNKFIKWGGIISLTNLLSEDHEARFRDVFDMYYKLIDSEVMVTAVNVINNTWKIIEYYPDLEKQITEKLLSIESNNYMHKGKISSECKNIVLGAVIN
ncbi:MAG TPA: hypothetical protein VLS94_01720, partial [Fusibacter sp.]|nr:hypothetical protein [Fusibacter sp.]